MLSRTAARAVSRTTLSAAKPVSAATRTLFVSAVRKSGDHHDVQPRIYGPGAKPGEVPSAYDQATGVERLQVLGEIEGIDVFDKAPLDASRIGTKKDPIIVASADSERLVGCTGFPADSHDTIWFPLRKDKQHRCVECGSVYAMDHQPLEVNDHHHH